MTRSANFFIFIVILLHHRGWGTTLSGKEVDGRNRVFLLSIFLKKNFFYNIEHLTDVCIWRWKGRRSVWASDAVACRKYRRKHNSIIFSPVFRFPRIIAVTLFWFVIFVNIVYLIESMFFLISHIVLCFFLDNSLLHSSSTL